MIKLADRCGALLSNTLPARGLFDGHPFGLGTTGSYFTSLGREMYEAADVVLAVGTSLSYYVGGGHYWGKAYKIQLDDAPRGLRDGQKAADIYVRSDALVGVEAMLAGLDKKLGVGKPTAAAIRSKELAHRIATEPPDSMPFDIEPGVLDPREVIRAIDGPLFITSCITIHGACDLLGHCTIKEPLRKVNDSIKDLLNGICIADLVEAADAEHVGTGAPVGGGLVSIAV